MDFFKKYDIPINCPVCGAKVIINSSGFPICPNPDCKQKMFHRFMRFFSVLEVKGAGESFINSLVSKDITPPIFIKLCKEHNEKVLCECAGGINGKKILANTLSALDKEITIAKYLALFDYDGFDEKKLKQLNDYKLEELFNLTLEDIEKLDGFASITANKLLSMFKILKGKIIDESKDFKFYKSATVDRTDSDKGNNFVLGHTFCFTGKACRPRTELQKLVEEKGGKNLDSVTSKLDYLVTDDTESNSSKNKKAKELGTKVISSIEFLKLAEIKG